MPDLFSLVLGGNGQVGWKANRSIIAPGDDLLAVAEDALYYERIDADVNEKILAGYPTSIIDLWGRALSFHFFNGTTNANFYNPTLPHDNALLFSNIHNTLSFNAATVPYPIVVASSRVSIADQTDAESPYTYVPITNTQFEFTPYTFGSFDPTLAAFIPIENAGTLLNNGKLPSGVKKCTVGYDNAGSAALFNGVTDNSDLNTVNSDLEKLVGAFKKLEPPIEAAVPLVANWPNSFQNYVPTTSVAFESAGNQILELVDGGEIESIPLCPLLVKARAQDLIVALDASGDTTDGWAAGDALTATLNRTSTSVHGFLDFPPVPKTQAEFIAAGLLDRPTFFGCNTTGNGDTSVLGTYPIILYVPNSPVSSFATNTSTFTLTYTEAEQREFLVAAQTNSIRGYSVDPNGVDEQWPLAIKCAVVDRARKRDGQRRSAQCQVLFDKCKLKI
ncbi:hypothetical protein RQP46_001294 [Phenoliferia psychrophenolica]